MPFLPTGTMPFKVMYARASGTEKVKRAKAVVIAAII
jgi:hypothetical protein